MQLGTFTKNVSAMTRHSQQLMEQFLSGTDMDDFAMRSFLGSSYFYQNACVKLDPWKMEHQRNSESAILNSIEGST